MDVRRVEFVVKGEFVDTKEFVETIAHKLFTHPRLAHDPAVGVINTPLDPERELTTVRDHLGLLSVDYAQI